MNKYRDGYTEEELLEKISICHSRNGKVNGKIINNEDDLPCRKTFYNKFGSIEKAIKKAGYEPYHPQTKEKVEVECRDCGSIQKIYPYRFEKVSGDKLQNCKQCMDKKVEVECMWCDNEFKIHRYRTEEEHEGFFCSNDCEYSWRSEIFRGENHPRWKDELDSYRYGSEWSEKREERIEMDSERCVSCGMSRGEHYDKYGTDIQVHHKRRLGDFIELEHLDRENAHNMNNLETLCAACHRKVETNE